MIRIAIVEDEENAVKLLENYLTRFMAEAGESYTVKHYADPVAFLDKYEGFDLVFMDIEMPHMDGMEGARRLREIDSEAKLIFVTNMAQYAAKGYEVEALDFVVKPVAYSDFSFKMKRAMNALRQSRSRELIINQPFGMVRMGSDGLMYVEVRGHKLTYHFVDKNIEARGTMEEAQRQLEELNFLRPHNCYLVNPKYIDRVQGYSLFIGSEELMISHPRRKQFLSELGEWYSRGGA